MLFASTGAYVTLFVGSHNACVDDCALTWTLHTLYSDVEGNFPLVAAVIQRVTPQGGCHYMIRTNGSAITIPFALNAESASGNAVDKEQLRAFFSSRVS